MTRPEDHDDHDDLDPDDVADDGPRGRPGAEDDPRVQAGIDHLQRAAREVIAASRALLDVAEELVDDPRAVGGLTGLLASMGDLAARAARTGPSGDPRRDRGGRGGEGDHDDDPPVQRIPIS